jgi:hypothetical protein
VAETPIRGRWTIHRPHRAVVAVVELRGWCSTASSEPVQVVPVPDEAAIDRGAKGLHQRDVADPACEPERREWDRLTVALQDEYRADALAVLRAALDPDARPETPEERHHRELHDGTLNEMPPEDGGQ